ncbi:DUF427 domain-containing protein [Streptomyces sp. NPDC006879]|uniref:DUF427 domain-containing protein n=1 Tax=Streptomyces sp. NPDC006879 TaxID=3364767 RepID=UPI0036771388
MLRTGPEGAGRAAESVWDYPRPPRVEADGRHVVVTYAGMRVADTHRALRVLETSHPPVFYVPRADTLPGLLVRSNSRTLCEWKGVATYWDLVVAGRVRAADAAWSYEAPAAGYTALTGCLAFYPSRVEGCWVEGEPVVAQPGDFYGGWITSEIEGPFKGGPGSQGW